MKSAERPMRPNLGDVTVCAGDSVAPALAVRALRQCLSTCDFGAAALFTHEPIRDAMFQTVPIERIKSKEAYTGFILKALAGHIHTPFVLIVQWDGYVVAPSAWRREFLDQDLIGARWPWHHDGMTVGNGGFSLRSKRPLELIARDRFPVIPNIAEDELICRYYHRELVRDHGVKFSWEALADTFCSQRVEPQAPSFGLHGLFNMWRHVGDDEMIALMAAFPRSNVRSREFFELIATYVRLRKGTVAARLFRRLRVEVPPSQIKLDMRRDYAEVAFAAYCYMFCERASARMRG